MEKQKVGLKKRLISKLSISNILLSKYKHKNTLLKKNVSNSKKKIYIRKLPQYTITIRMKNNNVFFTFSGSTHKTLKTTSAKKFYIYKAKFARRRSIQKILRFFLKDIRRILKKKRVKIKAQVSVYVRKKLFKNLRSYLKQKTDIKRRRKKRLQIYCLEQKKCFNGCRLKKKKRKKRKKARFRKI